MTAAILARLCTKYICSSTLLTDPYIAVCIYAESGFEGEMQRNKPSTFLQFCSNCFHHQCSNVKHKVSLIYRKDAAWTIFELKHKIGTLPSIHIGHLDFRFGTFLQSFFWHHQNHRLFSAMRFGMGNAIPMPLLNDNLIASTFFVGYWSILFLFRLLRNGYKDLMERTNLTN